MRISPFRSSVRCGNHQQTFRWVWRSALFLMLLGVISPLVTIRPVAAASVPVTVTILSVKCIDDCDAEGIEAAGESTPDFYARIYINGISQDTMRYEDDHDYIEPTSGWSITQTVDDSVAPAPLIPIAIQIWDHDSSSGDDNADTSPQAGHNNTELMVDLNTGKWSGDTTTSCVSGDGVYFNDTEYYAMEVCFDIAINSPTGDLDGDGLLDNWEINGFDANGDGVIDVDLPNMGASVFHKDLYLELDYETGRAPTRAGILAMKAAFEAAPFTNMDGVNGIRLHVDVGPLVDPTADEFGRYPTCANGLDDNGVGGIDGQDPLCTYLDGSSEVGIGTCSNFFDDDGVGGTDVNDSSCWVGDNYGGGQLLTVPVGSCGLDSAFYAAKSQAFNPNRRWIFRYAIQAASTGLPACAGGEGEIGGNDFVSHNLDAGTLMHELGHNLNLHHGGSVDANCKPNYVSVMNYNLQFGIPRTNGGFILDYSPPRMNLNGGTRASAPLNQLIENALNENVAIDPGDNQNQTIFLNGLNQLTTVNLNVNPNWNGDADPPIEAGLTVNIDNGIPATATTPGVGAAGCANTVTTDTLNGDHDWNLVSLPFRQFGDSADAAINPSNDTSPTDEEMEKIREDIHKSDLVAGLTANPDPVASGTDVTYNASVTNNGPNPALTTILTVTLPVETSLNSVLPAECCRIRTRGNPVRLPEVARR